MSLALSNHLSPTDQLSRSTCGSTAGGRVWRVSGKMEQGGGQRLTEQPSIPHRARNLVAAGLDSQAFPGSKWGRPLPREGQLLQRNKKGKLPDLWEGDSHLRGRLAEEMSRERRGKGWPSTRGIKRSRRPVSLSREPTCHKPASLAQREVWQKRRKSF